MNFMSFLTSDEFKIIVEICGYGSAIFIFIRGIMEYRNTNRTRQAEFLEKLITGFEAPGLSLALRILDGYSYEDRENNLLEKGQGSVLNLEEILRNHKQKPVTSAFEIKIRDSFCAFLDYISKLNYYLHNELINKDELQYFRYYIDIARKNKAIHNYIKYYYFYDSDFKELFEVTEKMCKE